MSDATIKMLPKTRTRTARPPLYRVVLVNDDYTPRDFVVLVLKGVFRMTLAQANGVMLTAHRKGVCVVAVFTRDIAETKADHATQMGMAEGYPLTFITEPDS